MLIPLRMSGIILRLPTLWFECDPIYHREALLFNMLSISAYVRVKDIWQGCLKGVSKYQWLTILSLLTTTTISKSIGAAKWGTTEIIQAARRGFHSSPGYPHLVGSIWKPNESVDQALLQTWTAQGQYNQDINWIEYHEAQCLLKTSCLSNQCWLSSS